MKVYLSHSVSIGDNGIFGDLNEIAYAVGLSLFQAPRPWDPRTLMPARVRTAILGADVFLVWAMAGGAELYYVNMEMSFVRNVRPQLPLFVIMDKNASRSGFLQQIGAGSRYGEISYDPKDLEPARNHAWHLAMEKTEVAREVGEAFRKFLVPAVHQLSKHLGLELTPRQV